MKTIQFPKMFGSGTVNLVSDVEATRQNMKLLILSVEREMMGDPFYGVKTKQLMFEQNNYILKDVFINELYTKIMLFMPQVIVKRNDITVTQEGSTLNCYIKAKVKKSYEDISMSLVLFENN